MAKPKALRYSVILNGNLFMTTADKSVALDCAKSLASQHPTASVEAFDTTNGLTYIFDKRPTPR